MKRWWWSVMQVWFFGGAVVMPLVYWPGAEVAFEVPRVWWVLRWIEGLVALSLAGSVMGVEVNRLRKELVALMGIWAATAVLASWMGVDWVRSVTGNYYRADGLATLAHLLVLALWVGMYWQRGWRSRWAASLTLGAVLAGVFIGLQPVIGDKLDLPPAGWAGGLGGTFGQPIYSVGYLLISLPFVIYLYRTRYLSRGMIGLMGRGAVVLVGAALGLGGSVVGWVGLAGIGGWWTGMVRGVSLRMRVWAVVGGVVLLGIAGLRVWQTDDYTPDSRERILRHLVGAWAQRPVFGWGWANIDQAFLAVEWPMFYQHDIYVDKAHSIGLEALTATGVAGLGIYGTMVWWFGRAAWKGFRAAVQSRERWWYGTVLAVMGVYLIQGNTNVVGIAEETVWWVTLGTLLVNSQGDLDWKKDD